MNARTARVSDEGTVYEVKNEPADGGIKKAACLPESIALKHKQRGGKTPADKPFDTGRRDLWDREKRLSFQVVYDLRERRATVRVAVALFWIQNKLHHKIQQAGEKRRYIR
jgi:hypothetical protein